MLLNSMKNIWWENHKTKFEKSAASRWYNRKINIRVETSYLNQHLKLLLHFIRMINTLILTGLCLAKVIV